jgi:hypothetical protein
MQPIRYSLRPPTKSFHGGSLPNYFTTCKARKCGVWLSWLRANLRCLGRRRESELQGRRPHSRPRARVGQEAAGRQVEARTREQRGGDGGHEGRDDREGAAVSAATTALDGGRLLARHGGVVEVRIPNTSFGTVSGYFDDLDALARSVRPWDGRGNVFVTLNPVDRKLLARATNHVEGSVRTATRDADIVRRVWFPIDCDSVRPKGISATDAELAAALARRDEIVAFLRGLGFPEPFRAMSGNGGHAGYAVDLPNDEPTRKLFESSFKALGSRFSDEVVAVDESVFNASRVFKLYGTLAVKGDATPERPHRRAAIESAPLVFEPVAPELLHELTAMVPTPRACVSTSAAAEAVPTSARAPRPMSSAMQYLLRHGGPTMPRPDRSRWALSIALGFVNAGRAFEEYFAAVRNPRNLGGAKVQEIERRRGLKPARDYAEGRWRKADARVAASPPFGDRPDALRALLEVERVTETYPWGGRAGSTDRAVLTAHFAIARRTGKLVHDASDREVADLAGVTRWTVRRAHRRLVQWLRRVRTAGAERAATWRLKTPNGAKLTHHTTSRPRDPEGLCGASRSHLLADPGCDVWRFGLGLGKRGWQTWEALRQPQAAQALAAQLGVGVRAAQQRLARLAQSGLAERDAEGVWHRLEPDGDEVAALAARLGTAGAGRRQRWRHQDEREVRAKALAFFRWQRRHAAAEAQCRPGEDCA